MDYKIDQALIERKFFGLTFNTPLLKIISFDPSNRTARLCNVEPLLNPNDIASRSHNSHRQNYTIRENHTPRQLPNRILIRRTRKFSTRYVIPEGSNVEEKNATGVE